eukprot:scaffold33009_cov57-Phaeocystis_antarctica.AAC.4
MRVQGGPSIWKTRLWRLWCGGRWRTDAILIFSMCSTTLVFPVEHFGPVLRGETLTSPSWQLRTLRSGKTSGRTHASKTLTPSE